MTNKQLFVAILITDKYFRRSFALVCNNNNNKMYPNKRNLLLTLITFFGNPRSSSSVICVRYDVLSKIGGLSLTSRTCTITVVKFSLRLSVAWILSSYYSLIWRWIEWDKKKMIKLVMVSCYSLEQKMKKDDTISAW